MRAKLQSKSGKQYWRTLDELADDPHFEQLLHREFPRQASEWDESVDRRDFLKLMAASLAFAGLAGCKANVQTNIVPYVKQPDGMVLGKPLYFATAMPFGADAIGLLVESHEGRPTNIAGNPDHPSSLGCDGPDGAGFDPESVRPGPRANGHVCRRDSDLVGISGQRASDRGRDQGRKRRGLPDSDRHDYLADDRRADCRGC